MIKRQDIVGMTSKHIGQVCKLSQRLVGNQITHWTFHGLPKLQFLSTPQGVGGAGQPPLLGTNFIRSLYYMLGKRSVQKEHV